MTNTSEISSIPLTFNDSWLAYMGSRVYKIAIETIEWLSTAFSYPLVQPYSGRRLYQLVDTFCHSVSNNDAYNQARINYAHDLIKSLEGERNIFEKTKRVRTILNTNIIGLSILQNKDKQSLSDHIGFTVLPSLINGFGEEMANRAFLALDELDDESQKNLNEYAKLYRDLTLQQTEIDSFVKMLQELNGNVPREILIHELVLARNKHLTDAAKAKITSTLENGHYIQVKLQRKVEFIERSSQSKTKVDEKELTCELNRQRDTQLQTLNYTNVSMFSPEESALGTFEDDGNSIIADDESDDESIDDFEDAVESFQTTISDETTTSEPCTAQIITETTPTVVSKPVTPPEMPVGIVNKGDNNNCWYNAALQLLYNTSLFYEICQKENTFFETFPNIAESLVSYNDKYWEQADIIRLENPSRYGTSKKLTQEIEGYFEKDPNLLNKVRSYRKKKEFEPLDLTDQMQKIRSEIHYKVAAHVAPEGTEQEDCRLFLIDLLQKLSIDVAYTVTGTEDIYNITNKYAFIHKPRTELVDLKGLCFGSNYVINAVIIHSGEDNAGHYYSAIRRNQVWYLCDDSSIKKVSEELVQQELHNNAALIMATNTGDVEENLPVQPQDSMPQRFVHKLLSRFRRT